MTDAFFVQQFPVVKLNFSNWNIVMFQMNPGSDVTVGDHRYFEVSHQLMYFIKIIHYSKNSSFFNCTILTCDNIIQS